jgi:TPR repeat protein
VAAAVLAPAPAGAPGEPVPAMRPAPPVPAPQVPSSAASPVPKPPSDRPRLAAVETAALLARGDSLLGVGDIASARLFYERASDAGDGRAALRLGATYDPGFLDRAHLPHLQADVGQALSWYHRARDLGEGDAELWIQGLETKSGR